jgi:hypothetical protein
VLENALSKWCKLKCALKRNKDRVRKHTIRDMRAQRHAKKIGLENTLSEWWELKDALEGNKDRVRKQTIWDIRAQRRAKKRDRVRNALSKW